MTLVVLAVLAALVLAVSLGGRPSTFRRPPLRRIGLVGMVPVSVVTASLAHTPGVAAGWLVVAALCLVWFAALNRGRPGIGLMILGLGLNALVITINWGMPVSMAAVERAGVPMSQDALDTDPLREELTDQTQLPWLGEVVPLALPVRPAVASPGDVLVAAGGALFIFTGLTGIGRSVPDKVLTPVERRKNRRSRKAAAQAEAEAEAAGLAGPGFADSAMRERAEEDSLAAASTAGLAPALLVDSFGDPVSIDAVSSASASPTGRPPSRPQTSKKPAGSKKGGSAKHSANPSEVANPLDPEAAERKKLKRQLKKLKKQARKRRLEVAASQAASEPDATEVEPTEVGPHVDDPSSHPPGPTSIDPQPELAPPSTPPAHISVVAARGRQAVRSDSGAAPATVNGADEGSSQAQADRARDRSSIENEDVEEDVSDTPPVTTPTGAATAGEVPPR